MDAAGNQVNGIEDIYHLPEGQRAELIDGRIYDMAAPGIIHQTICGNLYYRIREYLESNGGKCSVFFAPFGVFLFGDDTTYLEPDISVICDRDKLTDKGCQGAPDWVIEVVSPSSRRLDYYLKLFQYQRAGLREYWIVDPDRSEVIVYNFEKETMEVYPFGQEIPAGIYDGFSLTVE